MATVKTLALFVLLGAGLGLLLASLLAPSYLTWDNTVAAGQALCECGKCAGDTAARLLATQAQGAGAGGVVFLALGIAWEVRKRKKQPQAAAPA